MVARLARVSGALVLNATYEPLCVVSVRRATILVLTSKAVCVADGDGILHSAMNELPVPSVVRLTRYVRVPYRTHIGLSRRGIFARDGWRCAYCRGPAETIDHVMPRSRGGRHLCRRRGRWRGLGCGGFRWRVLGQGTLAGDDEWP